MSLEEVPKLDRGLSEAYRVWRENTALAPDAGIAVSLMYTGELAAIEAVGFQTHAIIGDQAYGLVYFKDIPALVAHDGVMWIAAGRPSRPDLVSAVKDIQARASALSSSGQPVHGLWYADDSSGALTHLPKATGKGVIVAILDSGIDFTHPMFLSQSSPAKTRILRIWDQGLTPATGEKGPPTNLLVSHDTYGVEFKSSAIEAHLNGGAQIAHQDCNGHGTHVAGIAAGGTHHAAVVGNARRVGVAPEADIIAVKLLDVPDQIFYKLQSGATGDEVAWHHRFVDAVVYCLRTAHDEPGNPPVVINMSIGADNYPGDGLDEEARAVDDLLDPAQPPSDLHFPRGAIVVKSAGNLGPDPYVKGGLVGRIEVPASGPTPGEIIVPFALIDDRDGANTTWQRGDHELYAPEIGAHFWYPRPSPPLSVQFAVRLPFGSDEFSADVSANITLRYGFNPDVGPPRNDIITTWAADSHRITIVHEKVGAVPHPAGGTVQRNYAYVSVGPKVRDDVVSYHGAPPGAPLTDKVIYEVRIKAPPNTPIFVVGEQAGWDGGLVAFRMNDKMRDHVTARHANIKTLNDRWQITDGLGQHAITVSAYTEHGGPGKTPDPPPHGIADLSSRGPLRDYSDPPQGPLCDKPDIAAPGVGISSARSRHTEGLLQWPWWYWGVRFEGRQGTSMAAPMVAGVIALLLEKNPQLNTDQVRAALSSTHRPAVWPPTKAAYGAGMVDALTSHTNTP